MNQQESTPIRIRVNSHAFVVLSRFLFVPSWALFKHVVAGYRCVGHSVRQRPPPRSPAQQHAPLLNLPLSMPTACFNRD